MYKLENRELRRECKMINEELNSIEVENLKLRKKAHVAMGASTRLEKMVYGIQGPPRSEKKTSRA